MVFCLFIFFFPTYSIFDSGGENNLSHSEKSVERSWEVSPTTFSMKFLFPAENHLSMITAFSKLLMDSPCAPVTGGKLSGTWTKALEV